MVKRPKTISVCIRLQMFTIFCFIMAVLLGYLNYRTSALAPQTIYVYSGFVMWVDSATYIVLVALLSQQIGRGHNWARIAYILYIIARFILHAATGSIHGNSHTVDIFVVLYYITQIVVFILLFVPSSNRWFKSA